MERRNVIGTDSIRLPDGQHVNDIDETGYTYLGILERLIRSKKKK